MKMTKDVFKAGDLGLGLLSKSDKEQVFRQKLDTVYHLLRTLAQEEDFSRVREVLVKIDTASTQALTVFDSITKGKYNGKDKNKA